MLGVSRFFWEPEIEMTGKVPKSNDTNLNMESLWNTLKHKMTDSCRFTSSHQTGTSEWIFLEDSTMDRNSTQGTVSK